MNETNVGHEPDDDLIRSYVARTLPEAEAERFEEHYFACDRCWKEVQAANEVREALLRRPAIRRRTDRQWWIGLAAAAIAAFAFIGIRQFVSLGGDETRIYRGADDSLQTTILYEDSSTAAIGWHTQPEARAYSIQILNAKGTRVFHEKVSAPPLKLDLRSIPGASHYRVLALDEFGGVIADSGLQKLQSR